MKICIDALTISCLTGIGIGSYNYEFFNKLFEMYPSAEYDLIWDIPKIDTSLSKTYKKLSFINLNLNRIKNDFTNIDEYIKKRNINIYHSPNNGLSIPKEKSCKYVTTVHNLLPLVNHKYVDDKYMKKFDMLFPNAMEKSDKVIVVSEYIKHQLRNYFSIPEKNIQVIYPGCSELFKRKDSESCNNILKSKYGLEEEYLLHVGSLHQRKNLEKLIIAFEDIIKVVPELKLVIVGKHTGKREKYYKELKVLIDKLDIKDSVIFIEKVSYEDMPYFYTKAKCTVNLSKYEGFPMSILESIGCETPVICDNQIFFKEVLKAAGVFVDANDKRNVVENILKIILDDVHKDKILKDQINQCKSFDWSKNIRKVVRVYENL